MERLTIFITGVGLAMDAFAVSLTNGVCDQSPRKEKALLGAFLFGFFQGLMPLLGYWAGAAFLDIFFAFDHWIALFLLSYIGIHMVLEGLHTTDFSRENLSLQRIFVQAVATLSLIHI